MRVIINEGSTGYLTVGFTDQNGNPVVPDSVRWEAIDPESGEVLVPETNIPPAATVEISIPASVNVLANQEHEYEIRRILVKTTYGQNEAANGSYDYLVQNLSRVP